METPNPHLSPRKRLKMDDGGSTQVGEAASQSTDLTNVRNTASKNQTDQLGIQKESEVGILLYVNPSNIGFGAVLKKRYTDFMVNEIMLDGTTVHLDSYKVPERGNEHATAAITSKAPDCRASNDETKCANGPEQDAVMKEANEEVPVSEHEPGHAATTQEDANQAARDGEVIGAAQTAAEDAKAAHDAQSEKDQSSNWRQYAESHPSFKLSAEDRTVLEAHLGPSVTEKALALFNSIVDFPHRKPAQYGVVKSEAPIDRESRTTLHQAVRRIFIARLESYTEADGIFVLAAPPQTTRKPGGASRGRSARGRGTDQSRSSHEMYKNMKDRFAGLGGEHCHFSLYKENKDTMEVISFIAKQLQAPPKNFNFAGTKDRRAVTLQRVSVFRVFAQKLNQLNGKLRGSQVGNFTYKKDGLNLGDLLGNEFTITLRDCELGHAESQCIEDKMESIRSVVNAAVKNLTNEGFLNYYGLQRFGTFTMRTDTIGVKLLKGDYEGAVNAMLYFNTDLLDAAESPDPSQFSYNMDDVNRAVAINMFWRKEKLPSILEKLPRKFTAESNVIRHLYSSKNQYDFLGAVYTIPRNLRLMYSHAYQSLIWNHAASHRWSLAGSQLLEGDLVLVHEHKDKEAKDEEDNAEVDEDGEPIFRPSENDRAVADDERFERARALTCQDIESGKYSIFDIVLPTPGFDITYPSYMVKFYQELMGKDELGGLDPYKMRRSVKDLSLSGNYRKLLARPVGPCECQVVSYIDENQQFIQTDLEILREKQQQQNENLKQTVEEQAVGDDLMHGRSDLQMGMDGTVESKIKELKDSLLGPSENSEDATKPAIQSQTRGSGDVSKPSADAGGNVLSGPGGVGTYATTHDKIAVILKLQLGASTYATMALREISRGGIAAYKPDFGGGR